jgi:hypothetical protein
LRIRLAERTVLVALAQASVLAENYGGETSCIFIDIGLTILRKDLKKWSKEELGAKCDEGANILKSVYRSVLTSIGNFSGFLFILIVRFSARSLRTILSSPRCSPVGWRNCKRRANSRPVFH